MNGFCDHQQLGFKFDLAIFHLASSMNVYLHYWKSLQSIDKFNFCDLQVVKGLKPLLFIHESFASRDELVKCLLLYLFHFLIVSLCLEFLNVLRYLPKILIYLQSFFHLMLPLCLLCKNDFHHVFFDQISLLLRGDLVRSFLRGNWVLSSIASSVV